MSSSGRLSAEMMMMMMKLSLIRGPRREDAWIKYNKTYHKLRGPIGRYILFFTFWMFFESRVGLILKVAGFCTINYND